MFYHQTIQINQNSHVFLTGIINIFNAKKERAQNYALKLIIKYLNLTAIFSLMSLPSSAGQDKIKIRTGRDSSPIPVMGKRDSAGRN